MTRHTRVCCPCSDSGRRHHRCVGAGNDQNGSRRHTYGPPYTTDVRDGFYCAAYYMDRLLEGAMTLDLPFKQTANVKLVVNQKTAGTAGNRAVRCDFGACR